MAEPDNDEQFYRDTESIAFPKLDDRQLAMLEPLGSRRVLRRGEILFKAGQRDLGLTVILRGGLEVFEARDGEEQILGTPGPRDFVGDVAMLMGTAALASARGKADETEILEVPAAAIRQALAELPGVSEPIVRAFIMRRQRLRRDREFAGLRIVAQDGSRDGNQLGVEYYSSLGQVGHFDNWEKQQHQIFPTLDLNFSPDWEFNLGIGVGLTRSTDDLMVKLILGRRF